MWVVWDCCDNLKLLRWFFCSNFKIGFLTPAAVSYLFTWFQYWGVVHASEFLCTAGPCRSVTPGMPHLLFTHHAGSHHHWFFTHGDVTALTGSCLWFLVARIGWFGVASGKLCCGVRRHCVSILRSLAAVQIYRFSATHITFLWTPHMFNPFGTVNLARRRKSTYFWRYLPHD